MEAYAQVLNIAIPVFIALICIEYLISRFKGIDVYHGMDTISSLSSGMTNTLKDVLGLVVIIISYTWLVETFAVFTIESTFWLYVLAFVGKDFAGYWSHRFEHIINIFWNRHIIHHSSEEFNLACALRQSISGIFAIFTFLYIPMAIVGVPAEIIGVVAPLHLFMQFWYHTRLINKMGILEYFLVTPSHHRVHHAINDEYIDKNFGQIFIVWDKMFGTFQPELQKVPAVYGVKQQVATWNPVLINFKHFWGLVQDAWRTNSWIDKCRIWFMPTGWRPDDVQQNYPVDYIHDVYDFEKYETPLPKFLKAWSFVQLAVNNLLMLFLFNQLGNFTFEYVLLYGLFLLISIFAYTSLMDRSILSIIAETLKVLLAILLMVQLGNWYNIDYMLPYGSIIFITYLFLSFGITVYFTWFSKPISEQKHLTIA